MGHSDHVSVARNWYKGSRLAFPLEEAPILARLNGFTVLYRTVSCSAQRGNEGERVSPPWKRDRALLDEGPIQSGRSSC